MNDKSVDGMEAVAPNFAWYMGRRRKLPFLRTVRGYGVKATVPQIRKEIMQVFRVAAYDEQCAMLLSR